MTDDNVIYVDFAQNRISPREEYLHLLATEMDELDFQDFVAAVNDPEIYAQADQELQDLVTSFFEKKSLTRPTPVLL